MKEIFGIGLVIPSNQDDYIKLDSLTSLSECDIAVFNPSFDDTYYYTEGSHAGKTCYDSSSSSSIQEHAAHWRKEIINYLNSGKNLFLSLCEKRKFYVHTGKKDYSGTGRNRQTINLVTDFSNYNYLPDFKLKFDVAHGKKMYNKCIFSNFLKDFEKFLSYETYIIEDKNIKNEIITKSGDKILGGIYPAYGGNIIILPKISFNIAEFIDEEEKFTNEAKIFGQRFKEFIIEIDKTLKSETQRSPKPKWVDEEIFELKPSINLTSKINEKSEKVNQLNIEISLLSEELYEQEKLKDLLYETGKPLEEAVTKALKILGFSAENFDDGILELDQVIISPEGVRYIGECEGKDSKAIDITKFRQLSDALNEDFEREDVSEKAFGILFGNPHRNIKPDERKDFFTQKCITGAKREKIALISTVELFNIVQYLLTKNDEYFKKKCRENIFKNLGEIVTFEIPK